MRLTRTKHLNPLLRWRWDIVGEFGYSSTKRGAASAARAALLDRRERGR